MSDQTRVLARYGDAACDKCGSCDLGLIAHGPDYWRKECLACGSCGPFVPIRDREAQGVLEEPPA